MNKSEFLDALKKALADLPKDEIQQSIEFYSEMIDDRIEEGLSEKEAVLDIGSIDEIRAQLLADVSLVKIVKEKITPKRKLKPLELTLIILGFPLWFSLLCAAFAVVVSLYAALWSVIISLWAVFVASVGSSLGFVFSGVTCMAQSEVLRAIAFLGFGISLVGISILLFFVCKAVTKGCILVTKKTALAIKKRIVKKEAE